VTFDSGAWFRFLIAALATWRLAFLLARERGPWNVLGRFRRAFGGGVIGELLACVKCVGLWVAIPFASFVRGDWWELLVIWLALAGVTALIDEWTRPPFEWRTGEDASTAADDGERRIADDGSDLRRPG
jgi:cobalamin synthase